MSGQLSLWDRPSLNPIPRVKEAMRQALKASSLSREQVVDRMNAIARAEGLSTNGKARQVTADMLDKWVADSGEHLIPWKLLPIFCFVVENITPLHALAAPIGVSVIDKEDALLLQWAKAEMNGRKLKKQQRQLQERLGI